MIRHIVTWKLAATEEPEKTIAFEVMAAALRPLAELVPDVASLRVERNMAYPESNWDVVLVADFPSEEALEAYRVHPEHQRAAAVVRERVSERAAVDFIA